MKKLHLVLIASLFVFSALGYSDTILVPADQPTIQAGIDAAVTGDTVLVAAGTYYERIDFKGKDLVVTSESGPSATIIDGEQVGPVVTFDRGETAAAELSGFTITSGDTNNGGGIYCSESHPTITGNIIEENCASNSGSGIYCNKCGPIITNNVIRGNAGESAVSFWLCYYETPLLADNLIEGNYSKSSGGGVNCTSCSPEIHGNVITNNVTDSSGGGIACYGGDPVIMGNTITYNQANVAHGRGGGIYLTGSSKAHLIDNVISHNYAVCGGGVTCEPGTAQTAEIVGNEISHNTGDDYGGGICCYTGVCYVIGNTIVDNNSTSGGGMTFFIGSKAIVKENTVAHNSADNGGGLYFSTDSFPAGIQPALISNLVVSNTATYNGGGVFCDDAFPKMVNPTIANNTAADGGGLYVTGNGEPQIINGIVWHNDAPTHAQISILAGDAYVYNSNIQGGWVGIGNIDADPLFVDQPDGDFHLTHGSPCRDAGDNAMINQAFDFEGDRRKAFGTVDMGADEFYNHLYCTGDFVSGGSVEGKLIGPPGFWPVGLFLGSGILETPLQHNWGDFYLESPWYLIPLVPIPSDGVLRIPANLPSIPAPYDIYMQALIGWKLSNPFVVEVL